jgi:hypothetical protein
VILAVAIMAGMLGLFGLSFGDLRATTESLNYEI